MDIEWVFSQLLDQIPFVKGDIKTLIAGMIGLGVIYFAFSHLKSIFELSYDQGEAGQKYRNDRALKSVGRDIKRAGPLSMEKSSPGSKKRDFDFQEDDDEMQNLSVDWDYDKK